MTEKANARMPQMKRVTLYQGKPNNMYRTPKAINKGPATYDLSINLNKAFLSKFGHATMRCTYNIDS